MATTMEQQRAADAWECMQRGRGEEYVKLAKGVPALIMNSGLLQVLAFLHEKESKTSQRHCGELGDDLRTWLAARFSETFQSADFDPFMVKLMTDTDAHTFRLVTIEAFAWLRWLRQIGPAAIARGN